MMRPSIEDLIAEFDGQAPVMAASYNDARVDARDIEYYSQLDPVLIQLYKDYCEAQARYYQLDDGTARNAAMREVAEDMKDSAWSALQTRLIEIREGDERAAAMKAMHNLREDKARMAEQRNRDHLRQAGFREQRETIKAQKEQRREEAANSLLAYVFLFWFQLRWASPETTPAPQPRSAFSQVA